MMSSLTTPIAHSTETLTSVIRKGNKRYTVWKGRHKNVFICDDMIFNVESPPKLIPQYGKVSVIARMQDTGLIYKSQMLPI